MMKWCVCWATFALSCLGQQVTYDDDILPRILGPFCVSCHGPGQASAGLRFHTYASATSGGAHARANSAIQAGRMPQGAPLGTADRQLFQAWIEGGALEAAVALPPQADAGDDFEIPEGVEAFLDGTDSSDLDGIVANHAWAQVAGPSVALAPLGPSVSSFITPEVPVAGALLTFRLTVTDNDGATDTDEIVVTVTDNNLPPVADAGMPQAVEESDAVQLDGSGSEDPDGSIVAYQWERTVGPAVVLNSTALAMPTFVAPLADAIESITFKLTVTDDGGLMATDTVEITVSPRNQPPTAKAGADANALELTEALLDGSASTDPDGQISSFSWTQTQGTDVMLSDDSLATPTFATPDVAVAIVLTFRLTVTDNSGDSASDLVSVTVFPEDTPLVSDAGPDRAVPTDTAVPLDGRGSHAGTVQIGSYQWSQIGGSPAPVDDADQVLTFATLGDVGVAVTYQLRVTDEFGRSDTDTVTLMAMPTLALSLRRGWNLISFPFDLHPDAQLPGQAWLWTGEALAAVPTGGPHPSGMGLWLFSPSAHVYHGFGVETFSPVVLPPETWLPVGPIDIVPAPPAAAAVFRYSGVSYEPLAAGDLIFPGQAYWMYFQDGATLDLREAPP